MNKRKLRDGTTSFAGGLNLIDDETALRSNELLVATNVSLIGKGMAARCNGFKRTTSAVFTTAATPQNTMIRGWGDTSSNLKIVLFTPGDTKISNTNGHGVFTTTDTTFPFTWTNLGTGGVSFVLGTRQYGADVVRIGSNIFVVLLGTLTGNEVAVLNSTYTGYASSWTFGGYHLTCVEGFNGRLFGAAGTSLVYSTLDVNALEGVIVVNGSGNINALKASADALYIFHDNSISVYTGWSADDISVAAGLRGLSAQVGSYSRHVVTRGTDECIYFAGSDGYFYRITPQGELQNLSINRLERGASLSLTSVGEDPATGEILWGNADRVDSFNATGATTAYVYNYRLNAWTTRDFATALGTANDRPHNFFTNAYENKLYSCATNRFVSQWTGDKFDVLYDGTGGYSFAAQLETKKFVFKDALANKMFNALYLEGTDNTLGALTTVNIGGESGAGGFFLKLDPPYARQGRPPWRYRIDQTSPSLLPGRKFRSMSAVFQWQSPGTPEALSAVALEAYDYGIR